MTLERASELVLCLRMINEGIEDMRAIDLFSHFVEFFNLRDENLIEFARLCGYQIATIARVVDEEDGTL